MGDFEDYIVLIRPKQKGSLTNNKGNAGGRRQMKPSLGMSPTESGSGEFALRRSPRLLGKFGLRRSPRLLGKSAMSMPKRSQIAPRKSPAKGKYAISPRKSPAKGKSAMTMLEHSQISPRERPDKGKSAMSIPKSSRIKPRKSRKSPAKGKSAMTMPESPCKSPAKDVIDHELTFSSSPSSSDTKTEEPDIATEMRLDRKRTAQHFRKNYTYSDMKERKTCIHPGGAFSWEGKDSSGFTYVAFRWMRVTCVVFKRTLEHVKDRLCSYLVYNKPVITYNLFGKTAISDIEVLGNLTSESSQGVVRGERIDEPFAIVSVDPSNDKNDPVKDEDQLAVLEYFQGLLKKDTVLDPLDCREAPIHAFQLLYNQKFEAKDIWVAEASMRDYQVLPEGAINFYLAKINNTDEYQAYVAAKAARASLEMM